MLEQEDVVRVFVDVIVGCSKYCILYVRCWESGRGGLVGCDAALTQLRSRDRYPAPVGIFMFTTHHTHG